METTGIWSNQDGERVWIELDEDQMEQVSELLDMPEDAQIKRHLVDGTTVMVPKAEVIVAILGL